MTGSKPSLYWMICWKYISPFVMTIILLASFIQLIVNGAGYDAWISELGETKVMPWPWWAIIMIVFLIGISVLWIPIVALLRYKQSIPLYLEIIFFFLNLINNSHFYPGARPSARIFVSCSLLKNEI